MRAVLDDAVVLPSGLDEPAAFEHGMAARFFNVHVLARLTGPNRQQRVPMVRRGNRNRVEALVVERLAEVLHAAGRCAAVPFDGLGHHGEQAAVGVGQIGDLDVLQAAKMFDVFLPPAVDARHGNANPIVGAEHAGPRPLCRPR